MMSVVDHIAILVGDLKVAEDLYTQKLNGKVQVRLTEVEEDNKKLASQVEDKVNQLRNQGVL